MRECYDWNKNLLYVTNKRGVCFDLQMRGDKTIVSGNSGTGKTLLCNVLRDYLPGYNQGMNPYVASNIVLIDRNNLKTLDQISGKLVIIDRADMLLDDNAVSVINKDHGRNRYLIFLRKPLPLEITPNYYAQFKVDGSMVKLEYDFSVSGWW